jgi:hypothetical protein
MLGTSHEDQCIFMIVSHIVLLRMKNISDKCLEKIKTHILCSTIFSPENRVVCEIIWKNIVETDRSQMTT